MNTPRFLLSMLIMGPTVFGAPAVCGQDYPNRPLRIVSESGGNDLLARLIAQGLTATLGQQVIVDQRPSGAIPGMVVSQAPPDGYTLLVAGTSLWVGPYLQKTPYDPVRDFSPISWVTRAPHILVVCPSVPANSVKELIALAKAKPGELNYGSSGVGGATHLAAELFKAMAGVNIVRVPYKDTATWIADLISGQVHVTINTAAVLMPHVKSGKLRALGITSAQPSPLAPGLTTVAAGGLPGFESGAINGVFAPARTPATLINRLNQEIVRIMNQPDVKQKFLGIGAEVVGSSPQEFAAKIETEMARLGKLIKDVGITADQ